MGCRAGRGQTAGRTPTILLDKRAGTIVIERGRSVDCSNINVNELVVLILAVIFSCAIPWVQDITLTVNVNCTCSLRNTYLKNQSFTV